MRRRALLAGAAALVAGAPAVAKPLLSDELELSELTLSGDPAFGKLLLAIPRALPDQPELLVLLHGLGETVEQSMGARAFAERYGLLAAVARLAKPPVERTLPRVDYFGEGRLAELNADLAQRPFRCPVVVCPFTPNPYKAGGDALIARFAGFVGGRLKQEVESRVGVALPPSRSMISGVSLGGYLAIELFLKLPQQFCALGSVQGAFGPNQAARYAAAIADVSHRLGRRRVELLTSSLDPYLQSNRAFHRHLQQKQQPSRLRVSPGPHDQRWLNESGVIEMLLSANDVFAEQRAGAH